MIGNVVLILTVFILLGMARPAVDAVLIVPNVYGVKSQMNKGYVDVDLYFIDTKGALMPLILNPLFDFLVTCLLLGFLLTKKRDP